MIPTRLIPQITPIAAKIYMALLAIADRTHPVPIAPGSLRTLRNLTALSRCSCLRGLDQLRGFQLIQMLPRRPHRPASYLLPLAGLPSETAVSPQRPTPRSTMPPVSPVPRPVAHQPPASTPKTNPVSPQRPTSTNRPGLSPETTLTLEDGYLSPEMIAQIRASLSPQQRADLAHFAQLALKRLDLEAAARSNPTVHP